MIYTYYGLVTTKAVNLENLGYTERWSNINRQPKQLVLLVMIGFVNNITCLSLNWNDHQVQVNLLMKSSLGIHAWSSCAQQNKVELLINEILFNNFVNFKLGQVCQNLQISIAAIKWVDSLTDVSWGCHSSDSYP